MVPSTARQGGQPGRGRPLGMFDGPSWPTGLPMRVGDQRTPPFVNALEHLEKWLISSFMSLNSATGSAVTHSLSPTKVRGDRSSINMERSRRNEFLQVRSMFPRCQRLADVSDNESRFVFLARPNHSGGLAVLRNPFVQKSEAEGFNFLNHDTLHCLRCGFHRPSGYPTRRSPSVEVTVNFGK